MPVLAAVVCSPARPESIARSLPCPDSIEEPRIATAAGNKPKRIEEYVGRISSGHENVSIARMVFPGGWVEPAQQPEFEEITIVLPRRGMTAPSKLPSACRLFRRKR